MKANDLLPISLSAAVPLHIFQIQKRGGPTEEDMERARQTSDSLGHRGDVLLYGGGRKGEVAHLFNGLAHAIAVLSFCPGGVTVFNQHWETKVEDGQEKEGT